MLRSEKTKRGRQKKLMKEISNMTSDRRRWRYSPNIRTLITYLLTQIKSENEDTLSADKKARIHNKRISNVLANLYINYVEGFPFLLYYSDFKNEYYRLKEYAKLPNIMRWNCSNKLHKNFDIRLLLLLITIFGVL